MLGYVIHAVDIGGSSDPSGYATFVVRKIDGLTKLQVNALGRRMPPQTPTSIVAMVNDIMRLSREKIGPVSYKIVLDCSNNVGIAHILANALPRDSIVAVKISGGDAHGAGVSALPIGEVGGHMTALPCFTLSRREMLLQLSNAFSQKRVALPLEDEAQKEGVSLLRDEMSRASLKTTASGRQVAMVQRGHDDVVCALAMGLVVAERLPAPRYARFHRAHRERRFSARAWT